MLRRPSDAHAIARVRLDRRAMLRLSTLGALLAARARTARTSTPAATPEAHFPGSATAAYALDLRLDAEARTLSGTGSIAWRNTTGRGQDTLHLRLYPNAAYYGDAGVSLSTVTVDGRPATAALRDGDPTVASIPLGRTVAPGADVQIAFAFETVVPAGQAGSFGILRFDQQRGSWALADWYPILAGWEPARDAWYLDPPTPFGDPTFAETATYTLALEIPSGLTLLSTGDLVSTATGHAGPDPSTIVRVETGPVREFAMALLPTSSDAEGDLLQVPAPVSGAPATPGATPDIDAGADPAVSVCLYTSEDIPGLADAILDAATTALPRYRALLGALPERALTIASAHLAGANGVSWPGMIWLDLSVLARKGVLDDQERPGLRFTVIHEVGHQWIGGLLGMNANDHGFLLEGLTNALAIGVIRDVWGADAAIEAMGRFVAGPYSGLVRDGRDVIADQPLAGDTNVVLRALGVYGKAGLGFEAIRQEMGDTAWRAALGAFAGAFRNRIFTSNDLRTALTAAASSPDRVGELWTFWFERANAALPDIDPVVQGAGR